MSLYRKGFKRLFDIVMSTISLIVLSPVIAIVAILVRTRLGSPIIFKQSRPGRHGKIFTLYKFRTMLDATDSAGELLSDEKRLTLFGKLLRSTSLDELPELWNILRGDMSFVGPRPLLVEYLELYNDEEKKRHSVRPGLTGLAQVNGRNALTWKEKFAFDIEYVKDVSPVNDLRILFATLHTVIRRTGIAADDTVTAKRFEGRTDASD